MGRAMPAWQSMACGYQGLRPIGTTRGYLIFFSENKKYIVLCFLVFIVQKNYEGKEGNPIEKA